ncbi:protein-cysteine N-palmitoyltransferase Rasp [Cimex lectularius]|uniref:Protein-cysteine N-palmitoyltransferase Rasp n=1 Tax=Cimex lectularius TaxID=79782 RepID=A0A8I6RV14_CIMLE|nr:protein-cysteine N-palmitoyltransferase Rasp [Cimex lectularius]
MSPLPKGEVRLYFVLWSCCFLYAMLKVHEGGNLLKSAMYSGDFSPGWPIFQREKDVSDFEWFLWTGLCFKLLPWFGLHLFLCELMRRIDSEALPILHFTLTISFVSFSFPLLFPLILIFQFSVFFVVMIFGSRAFVWTLGVTFIILINLNYNTLGRLLQLSEEEVSLVAVAWSWFHIRCIDFALSEVHSCESTVKKFLSFLGFVFYLPCFLLGPLIPYKTFKENLFCPYKPWTFDRGAVLAFDLFRVLVWYVVYEAGSHFFYCHAMHYHIDELVRLGLWTVGGVGLCMSQFFFIKYVVLYGFSIAIAKAERYDAPPTPRCVNRIYLYSDMWRHFDRGFYLFMFSSIYRPVCGRDVTKLSLRLFASFLCFCFVFLWHGINKTIFIWSVLNFVGVALEAVGRIAAKTRAYGRFESSIDPRNMRRLKAVVCTPLWIMAVVSNFVFFGGHELGQVYIEQVVGGDFKVLFSLFSMGYFMCQVSMEASLYKKDCIKNVNEQL